jgi:hypothetical protein
VLSRGLVFFVFSVAGAGLLAGCASFDVVIDRYPSTELRAVDESNVVVTEADDEHSPYDVVADIMVHGRQITAFGDVPTREKLKRRMRTEAALLGADAVVLVRFGGNGIGPFSWNELEGRGRAIRYRR